MVTVRGERFYTRPWGLCGGEAAASARAWVERQDGTREEIQSKRVLTLHAGDRLHFHTPGGGGYGDPLERSMASVDADVLDGKVSRDAARERYGVVVAERRRRVVDGTRRGRSGRRWPPSGGRWTGCSTTASGRSRTGAAGGRPRPAHEPGCPRGGRRAPRAAPAEPDRRLPGAQRARLRLIALFSVLPLLYVAYLSLVDVKAGQLTGPFVGIENYAFVLEDQLTWTAFRNTFYFSALSVAVATVMGTGIALLLDSEAPFTRLLLAAAVLPWAIPEVVNALMWKWIFDYNWGALNALLVAVGAIAKYRPVVQRRPDRDALR